MIRHHCKGKDETGQPVLMTFGDFYDPPMLNCPQCGLAIPFPKTAKVQGNVIEAVPLPLLDFEVI